MFYADCRQLRSSRPSAGTFIFKFLFYCLGFRVQDLGEQGSTQLLVVASPAVTFADFTQPRVEGFH